MRGRKPDLGHTPGRHPRAHGDGPWREMQHRALLGATLVCQNFVEGREQSDLVKLTHRFAYSAATEPLLRRGDVRLSTDTSAGAPPIAWPKASRIWRILVSCSIF